MSSPIGGWGVARPTLSYQISSPIGHWGVAWPTLSYQTRQSSPQQRSLNRVPQPWGSQGELVHYPWGCQGELVLCGFLRRLVLPDSGRQSSSAMRMSGWIGSVRVNWFSVGSYANNIINYIRATHTLKDRNLIVWGTIYISVWGVCNTLYIWLANQALLSSYKA